MLSTAELEHLISHPQADPAERAAALPHLPLLGRRDQRSFMLDHGLLFSLKKHGMSHGTDLQMSTGICQAVFWLG